MKTKDYISSSVLLALALVLFFKSRELTFWQEMEPGEGFFPYVLSILLGIVSLGILAGALLRSPKAQEVFKILGPKKRKFFLYLLSFFIFAVLFTKVGYSLMLLAYLIFILRMIEKQSWRLTLSVAAVSIVISYLLFVTFLSVSLPEGLTAKFFQLLKEHFV